MLPLTIESLTSFSSNRRVLSEIQAKKEKMNRKRNRGLNLRQQLSCTLQRLMSYRLRHGFWASSEPVRLRQSRLTKFARLLPWNEGPISWLLCATSNSQGRTKIRTYLEIGKSHSICYAEEINNFNVGSIVYAIRSGRGRKHHSCCRTECKGCDVRWTTLHRLSTNDESSDRWYGSHLQTIVLHNSQLQLSLPSVYSV